MHSLDAVLHQCRQDGVSFAQCALSMEAQERGIEGHIIREGMDARLCAIEESVASVEANPPKGKLVWGDGERLDDCDAPLCGDFLAQASAISLKVATGNAAMRRIVAAPTAGSCGILPGLLIAYGRVYGRNRDKELDALIASAAVGSVIASRATLAGSDGGCQAECGAAAAMGAAALVCMRDGTPEAVAHGAALVIQSISGLVCDPVAGLVEVPCVHRNGSLVALAAICADHALNGIRSVIPPDEVIDAMARIGRAIPPSLKETSMGGLATTPTGAAIAARFKNAD